MTGDPLWLPGMPAVLQPRRPEDLQLLYEGTPPWETGRPQPALLALAETGAIRGRVLDVGCGTGEHALLAASLGLEATGIDLVAAAIDQAREKAAKRGGEWSVRAAGTSCCASATGSRACSGPGGSARTRSGRPSPTGGGSTRSSR